MISKRGRRGERQTTYIICHEYKHEEEGNENCRAVQSSSQDSRSKRNGRSEEDVSPAFWL